MQKMSSADLRAAFLSYFVEHGHEYVPSGSLVPANDPTLLFTNAGMVQFKDYFLGRESRDYQRAVSTQACVRAGGKHNDLENVGYTARHHTFFEMLGNFSFGDYFKVEAIRYSWQFLTQVLKIPSERLWVTVFETDHETADIWLQQIKIDPSRFSRLGASSNFWSMGEIGPCGPCTEIFYDHGAEISGGPPGSVDEDGDRYVEIWNLVFMQHERSRDGGLTDLAKPSVDTGMGLERLAAVLQGVHNNYDTDLFRDLIFEAAQLANISDLKNSSLRVVADHIRSCAFLIMDGVVPSNDGRGYVLRRVIRRAIRHGYQLGIHELFFYKLVQPLCNQMGEVFPRLVSSRSQIETVLQKEEERFVETLGQGMKILEACVSGLKSGNIPGETVFLLYDTYGFPVDLTADFARERRLGIDFQGFEEAMDAQKQRARAASRFQMDAESEIQLEVETEFCGYQELTLTTEIVAIVQDGQTAPGLTKGSEGLLVLKQTPFYAESGGQVGDVGLITTRAGTFAVSDTRKQANGVIVHSGVATVGALSVGEECTAIVDSDIRTAITLNHSATHLLHAALRQILGDHVGQKGSLVDSQHLRFDFSHFAPLSIDELKEIEKLVNQQIRSNSEVTAETMNKDDALKVGAMALFGEKYGNEVRVLRIGEFSTELCGGTHVNLSGNIGYFKIISETGVAAGVRRVEAVTGIRSAEWVGQCEEILQRLSSQVKGGRDNLEDKVSQIIDKNRTLEKQLERLKAKLASTVGGDLSSEAVDIKGVKVLAAKLDEVDSKSMRDTVDQLKNKLGKAVIVLATVNGGRVALIAGVTKDLVGDLHAGELVNSVASKVGGKGGGRPDLAQAGGSDPSQLDAAMAGVSDWVRSKLD